MAEERIPSSVGDENREPEKKELTKDRKSLTGMSEKVKETLAPLLGGIKHHPEVEVDLGRESGAATYEKVPIGSTPMSRHSVVAEATTDPNRNLHALSQDVGLVHSSDVVRASGRTRPGHNPNEDHFVLDGNSDPAHQFRSTTPTSEAIQSRFTGIDRDRGRVSLNRLFNGNLDFIALVGLLKAFGSTDTIPSSAIFHMHSVLYLSLSERSTTAFRSSSASKSLICKEKNQQFFATAIVVIWTEESWIPKLSR